MKNLLLHNNTSFSTTTKNSDQIFSLRLKNLVLFHRIKSMIFPSFLLPLSTQSAYFYLYEKLLL